MQGTTERQQGGDVDDRATAAREHAGQRRAREPHRRPHVDADQPVGEVRFELGEGAVAPEAGVVDEQIDARVLVEALHYPLQLGGLGEVGSQHLDGDPGLRLQARGQRLQALATPRDDHEVAAVVRKAFRESRAYARRRAGDEGDAMFGFHPGPP